MCNAAIADHGLADKSTPEPSFTEVCERLRYGKMAGQHEYEANCRDGVHVFGNKWGM